jgi:hypothetical protein
VYGPAGTSAAEVTVVLGSDSELRLSHGAACASAAIKDSAEIVIMAGIVAPADIILSVAGMFAG